MNIDTQNANTIYNIGGNMHLHNSEEIVSLLNKDSQKKLEELYSISYFEVLSKEYSKKTLIDRSNEIEKIKTALDTTPQLMLTGEPGLGKTTNLFQLSKSLKNVIYISVKSKSPISIISYLINKIRLANNENLLELKDINEAFEWLQASLQKTKQQFIIDDCEQDIETISKIISIEKFETTFLFATRNKSVFESTGIKFYPCSPFSENEIRLFLEFNNINVGKLDFNNLVKTSCGNPLYLFYFSQYHISPLPTNLIDYQSAIWNELTPPQQEIISFISIPYFNISISQIAELLNYNSVLELSSEIGKVSSLVKNYSGILEIFHPSFKEFVIQTLNNKGLLKHFQERLGDFFLKKQQIIQAIYLLIDIVPAKVNEYLLDVFPALINSGELRFALKVLNTKLEYVKSDLQKGYIYYHLCHVHHLLGNKEESTISIDKALELLKLSKNKKFYSSALMFKAMNLIEQGKVNEAIEIADKVFANLKKNEKKFKAPLLVNLSKIYVDLSEFEKGAKVSKEAFEIFQELNFTEGIINSLVNLVSCLAQTERYRDDAEQYGLRLLEILKQTSEFSIEVIILNSLASIYREKEEYSKAKEFSGRAVQLCQKYHMKDKMVLNLINFGNILRDEDNLNEAKSIYEEALIKAKEYNLKRDEGRIYWILASMNRESGNLKLSNKYADKAINICSEINYYYGAANSCYEKYKTLLALEKQIEAANALVESAEFYGKIDQFSQSYQFYISEAIILYTNLGEKSLANTLINVLIENTTTKLDNRKLINTILDNKANENKVANLEKLFQKYFTINDGSNIIQEFLRFMDFCRTLTGINGQIFFKKIVDLIIKNLGVSNFSYSILAIAIEQSGNLLNKKELNNILISLQNKLPIFFVRTIQNETIIVSSISNKINLEIHAFDDEITCIKLAIGIILILHQSPLLIIDKKQFKEKKCVVRLQSYTDELRKIVGERIESNGDAFDKDFQSVHMNKTDYSLDEMIIVSSDYETKCNLYQVPENKVSFNFFFLTFMGIKNHFCHLENDKNTVQRKAIMNSLAKLFDYTNTSLKIKGGKFDINLDKINFKQLYSKEAAKGVQE